jgi:hypothetical protein
MLIKDYPLIYHTLITNQPSHFIVVSSAVGKCVCRLCSIMERECERLVDCDSYTLYVCEQAYWSDGDGVGIRSAYWNCAALLEVNVSKQVQRNCPSLRGSEARP